MWKPYKYIHTQAERDRYGEINRRGDGKEGRGRKTESRQSHYTEESPRKAVEEDVTQGQVPSSYIKPALSGVNTYRQCFTKGGRFAFE